MQTIGDRIWYRIHAFVLEKIAERLNEVGFTGGYLDAGHVSGGGSTTLSHSATGHTAATLGNVLYAAAAGVWTLLAGNTTTTRKFLRQTGTGAVSAAPAWDTIVDGDIPSTHSGSSHAGVVTTHEGAADPHTVYQKESEKGAASGYASLGADTLVPQDQLGSGAQDGTKFLRDDGTWQVAGGAHPDLATHDTLGLATQTELDTHAGAADPHTGYRLESADHTHATTGAQGGTISHGDLTGRDQEDHSAYIPISLIASDGDMLTYFDGQPQAIAVFGNEGDVLTTNGDGIPEWRRPPSSTVYKDTDQEVTNATLVSDSELTVTLATNGKYQFKFVLFFLNDGAAEGIKVSLAGTATVTDVKGQVSIYDDTLNTLVAFGRITALGGAGVGAGISSGSNYATIEGAIEITTAGTFLLQFAQNAAGASAGVHCEVGSSLTIMKTQQE